MTKLSQKEHSKEEILKLLTDTLQIKFSVSIRDASELQIYKALSLIVVDILHKKRRHFVNNVHSKGQKQVYYLSMEFLMGRSLKTSLYNLGLIDEVKEIFSENDINLERIYDNEPDAGLGNGGLGRLAACYLDGLATQEYPAMGYSICYEYGIFKQKLEDGWQTELPDNWLPGGDVWLVEKPDKAVEVRFDGELEEYWDKQYHCINYKNYTSVTAVPYDMYVSGFDSKGVSVLRLWKAVCPSFDMALFNKGDYSKALTHNTMAQAISKVLYPNDNHLEGKSLRLRQQYFMCSASIGDIVSHHMSVYGTLENLYQKVAIHINDTHPTLAIPELMRVLLDDCGYSWDKAWYIVTHTFAYTNHTVMSEALEQWDVGLMKQVIPRILSIIVEINNRYCEGIYEKTGNSELCTRMSIVNNNRVKMATLCVAASHHVNGVSKLHTEILKNEVFRDEYTAAPDKFVNVTNGIAYRRWLYQSNPELTELISESISGDFLKDGSHLTELLKYKDDRQFLNKLATIKKHNKQNFAKYVKNETGMVLNTDSIFDVQVKRLHEYKRQHLNVLNIVSQYNYLLNNPDAEFTPKTYIFAAKAAPGYYLAKQIIKLIWSISEDLKKHPEINKKLNVVFLENYCVTLSEILMPASEISEQISLAGTEASGTGNMKLMLNGAVTLGTMDGANVEIFEQVGKDNIVTFGMTKDEVNNARLAGYNPLNIYNSNETVRTAVDMIAKGFNGSQFNEVADSLKYSDPYMVLADFDAYLQAQKYVTECYKSKTKWNRMSLYNIANAGLFSADRAINEYSQNIWGLKK